MKVCMNCNEVGFSRYILDPYTEILPRQCLQHNIFVCNSCGIALEPDEYEELEDKE